METLSLGRVHRRDGSHLRTAESQLNFLSMEWKVCYGEAEKDMPMVGNYVCIGLGIVLDGSSTSVLKTLIIEIEYCLFEFKTFFPPPRGGAKYPASPRPQCEGSLTMLTTPGQRGEKVILPNALEGAPLFT